ncbi:MAG: glycosyl hydrolase 53 family protein [Ferruginibacter sp.]
MRMIQLLLQLCLLFALPACKKSASSTNTTVTPTPTPTPTDTTTPAFFAKGADVSWVTQMESGGIQFYNSTGTQTECMQLMKDLGMNSIRLRVWVNPSNNWCNTADVLTKALRAKSLGMKILLDFHYSDSWADPGQQNKPAAWASQDFATLKTSVSQHTTSVMTTLKTNGITPEWVQVGNETNDGMLWPDGKASTNMSNFTALINAGYDAVKAVSPTSKVVVHISNGYDNSLFRWIFDGLKNNGGKWDVIGMSLYPTATNWSSINSQCKSNMVDMIARYNKEIMICEVGMSWDQGAACKAFIADIITKTKALSNNKGLGVFYWEPEAYNSWQGYTLGAFDNTGRPTEALDAFH